MLAAEDAITRIRRLHREQAIRFDHIENEMIKATNDKKEPNAWLNICVGSHPKSYMV